MIDTLFLQEALPSLLRGALVSIEIAALSCAIGLVFGTALALLETGTSRFWRTLVTIYVGIIRGTPMLVQIMIVFFVLPQIGISFSAFWSAVVAIGLNSSAYLSQVIKAGIVSIGKGQWEAAYALGFSRGQALRYIILPQAVRVVLPSFGNEFMTMIKDSSLASTIGTVELVKEGSLIISRTYKVIPIYLMITVIYLVMTSAVLWGLAHLERKLKIHA